MLYALAMHGLSSVPHMLGMRGVSYAARTAGKFPHALHVNLAGASCSACMLGRVRISCTIRALCSGQSRTFRFGRGATLHLA